MESRRNGPQLSPRHDDDDDDDGVLLPHTVHTGFFKIKILQHDNHDICVL